VALILFGPKKLPDLARSLGRSIAAFKKAMKDGLQEEEKDINK